MRFNISKKNKYLLSSLVLVVFGSLFVGGNASAFDIMSVAPGVVTTVVGKFFEILINGIGLLLNVSIKVVMIVAKYDRFIDETAVTLGWEQVRNLANMFFIVILLVIAFATILRVDSYNVKKLLPKLVIMAVLINFSKMICGIIIEINQVAMMTFLNAIRGDGGAWVNLLGVQNFLNYVEANKWNGSLDATSAVTGYFLALIFLIVALVTVFAYLGVLVMRMVMLWVYIVLSPLAYLLAAFPQGQTYSNRWWDDFTKYAVTGPVLAFFLWLAMVSASGAGTIANDASCLGPYETLCTDNFLQFIIGIGMLLGGLQITSQIGGAVGSSAAKGLSRIQNGKTIAVKYAKDKSMDTAKWAGMQTLGVGRGIDRIMGRAWNTVTPNRMNVEGGLAGTAIQKGRNLANFSWLGGRNKDKIEADKSLHSYYVAKQEANGDQAKIDALRLKKDGKEYMEKDGNFVLADKNGAIKADGTAAVTDADHVYATRKGIYGQNVKLKEMGAGGADMFMGRASAMSMAWAAAKQATDKKISEEQAKIEASGMTTDMMMQSIRDGNVSGAEKMALALTMAVKEGFKKSEDVAKAKETLGSNQILLKKFNDAVDKKFAHLNYNTNTESGKAAFIKRLEGGKIDDVMDKSAYENASVLETINKSKGPVNFNEYIKKVGKTTAHKESLKKGLEEAFRGKDAMKDGSVDPMRKAMVEMSGDIGEAFKDKDMNTQRAEVEEAMNNLLEGYSAKQVANIDVDSFSASKMAKHFGSEANAGLFTQSLENAVKNNLDQKDVESAKRAGAAKNLENVLRQHAAEPKSKNNPPTNP
jgi:hypothetical protein